MAAKIRIQGVTSDTEIPTPSAGRSFLFFNKTDQLYKARLDDGSISILSVNAEFVEDVVGGMFVDSSTIEFNYNDPANEMSADIKSNSIDSSHVYLITPAKIGDSNNNRYQATVNTTTGSFTTAYSLDCSNVGSLHVEAIITCARTGGIAGNPGDGATFKRDFRVKSIGGVVSIHDLQSTYTSRDTANMKVDFQIIGTDINFRVGGVSNNNLRWNLEIIIFRNN
jgi:hypothetical protein